MAAWIPASEALPMRLTDVLVVWADCGEPSIDIAYRRDAAEWVLSGSDEIAITVTYWQPLPPLPSRKQGETTR